MNAPVTTNGWLRAMPWVFVLIWSTGFIVARYAMPHSPPLSFLSVRYALSIACFLLWIWWMGVQWPKERAQWGHLAVLGILMHAGYLGGVWVAVKAGMGSGLSALVVGLQPVLTALWVSAMASRGPATAAQITPRQWGGLLLGFAGLVLVVSHKFESGGPGDTATWLNLSFAVIALFSITAGTLYQKRFVKPCDVRSANAVQLGAALVVTLPLALLETGPMVWNAESLGALAWSVLVLTLGGSSLLYMLIQRGAAATVSSLMYLVPPCTAMLAWLLFGEPITTATLVGVALTAVGVALVVRATTPRPASKPAG
ncbi:MAG: DMT family transporter [Serpentinimonas sp.]|nr:DMT family transporter [Serpentinimonas sp.]